MKRIITLTILSALILCGQAQTKIIKSGFIYESPSTESEQLTKIDAGQEVKVVTQFKEYYLVDFEKIRGFMHNTCFLTNNAAIVAADQDGKAQYKSPSVLIAPGDDLIAAGKLLIGGVVVGIAGSTISSLMISRSSNLSEIKTASYVAIGTSIIVLVLEVSGYSKIISAGKKLKVSSAQHGIGLSFNLY